MRFYAGKVAAFAASIGSSLLTVASVIAAIPAPAAAIPIPAPAQAAPLWSAQALADLYAEAKAAELEGLDPAAYDLAGLATIAAGGDGAATDRIATSLALALATDYARGRIEDPSRFGWHIERDVDLNQLAANLQAAVRQNRVRPWLRTLLPQDPRYAALRAAYGAAPDAALKGRLRANLERWRWMPRALGADHIYVNVPSYTLAVVDEGKPVSTYTVVVGAPKTPTPQIAVSARSVVVNPWWNVPRSIAGSIRPGAGKGYVFSGGSVRQRPGPANALGKVKIDMPNSHSIYLHDTPSKALFAESSRAFSHGCIRVKDIDRLAAELLELDRGGAGEVRQALEGSATRTVALTRERPVYLVYFTADAGPDGEIVSYEDPYGRDAKLLAGLDRPIQLASAR